MNIVILTKGEWQAFELVLEVHRQKAPADRLLVWDDFSPPEWLAGMRDIAEVRQSACDRDMSKHRNGVKAQFPPEEWILMLDADERIQPYFIAALRAFLDLNPLADTVFLERFNFNWDARGNVAPPLLVNYSQPFPPDFQPRVFRNREAIHFEGVIHEGLHGFAHPLHLRGFPYTLIHHRQNCPRKYENFVENYAEYIRSRQSA